MLPFAGGRQTALSFLVVSALAACATGNPGAEDENNSTARPKKSDVTLGAAGNGNTVESSSGSPAGTQNLAGRPAVGALQGKVVAPEGTIPIAKALVYLTKKLPPALVTKANCDCMQVPSTSPYALTKIDGTFEISAIQVGKQYLVVQKGQFRRIRSINVIEGSQPVGAELTKLPNKNDMTLGDSIPNMLVFHSQGDYDLVQKTLDTLLGTPSKPYTVIEQTGDNSKYDMTNIKFDDYHYSFFPCGGAEGKSEDEFVGLKGSIEKGASAYFTDHMEEMVQKVWPDFIKFDRRGGETKYPASVVDEGLKAWLTQPSLGVNAFDLYFLSEHANISSLGGGLSVGKPVSSKLWIKEPQNPTTVTFEQGCGKVLYSSYHTEDGGVPVDAPRYNGVLHQDLALMYMIFESTVCTPDPEAAGNNNGTNGGAGGTNGGNGTTGGAGTSNGTNANGADNTIRDGGVKIVDIH